ncbi:MAG TPA: hypothetical protein VJU87_11430 [Gemmatimonadaceae bacterium]|nr:hypothetical protein [Gemmatimonadaceae bacterium]
MAKSDEGSEAKELQEAAAETQEPEAAARLRAENDAATRERQADAERGLEDAAGTLADNDQRLRESGGAMRARERDLARTGDLARDVAEQAKELKAHTEHTVAKARTQEDTGVD